MNLKRRDFLAGTAAATLFAPHVASAQSTYVVPIEHLPRVVKLAGNVPAGELHVDPNIFKLYLTLPEGRAIQYAVGVGRAGLYESGEFFVGAKKEWPRWTPTPEMIEREPEHYKQYEDGMDGGPQNPLGARALYLFQPGRGDTFLRIHGTSAPRTIGTAVSNGCARLINSHAVHLYDRVALGSRVVLHPKV